MNNKIGSVTLERILSGLPDAVIYTGPDLKIRLYKGGAGQIFGFDEKDVLGKKITFLIDNILLLIKDGGEFHSPVKDIKCKNREGRNITVDLVNYITYENEGITWIFREQTDRSMVEIFLDMYHDNIERELLRQVNEKTHALENLTMALVNALENANLLNDTETGNHIIRVSEFSGLLAECLDASPDFIKRIKLYSPLHDAGKVGIPDRLLKKHGRYTILEAKLMQDHVIIGARMLDSKEIDIMAKNIVLYHHEKWDGSGYVKGLKGEEIPYEARIVAVADIFDALLSKRVYKEAYSKDKAHKIIRELGGTELDPLIVKALLDNSAKFDVLFERYK